MEMFHCRWGFWQKKKHLNGIITMIDLGAPLSFDGSLSYIYFFIEIHSNGEYNLNYCQILMSANS